MPNTKVKVFKDFVNPIIAKVLPVGFETVIEPKLSTVEKVIPAWYHKKWNKETMKVDKELLCPEKIIPIGNYEGYTFVGADGNRYNDHLLGFTPLDEVFTKLD